MNMNNKKLILQQESPVQLGACLASITAHRSCVQVDRESVASLEARVRDARKSAPANVTFELNALSQNDICWVVYIRIQIQNIMRNA